MLEAVAAIAGLADLAARTGSKLWQLSAAWRDAPEDLHRLRDDLVRTEQFFREIKQAAAKFDDGPDDAADFTQTDLQRLLGEGAEILRRIESVVDRVVSMSERGPESSRDLGKRGKLYWVGVVRQQVAKLRKELANTRSAICRLLIVQNVSLSAEIHTFVETSHDDIKSHITSTLETTYGHINHSIQTSGDLTISHLDYRLRALESSLVTTVKRSISEEMTPLSSIYRRPTSDGYKSPSTLPEYQEHQTPWVSVARYVGPLPRQTTLCAISCPCACHATNGYSVKLGALRYVAGFVSISYSSRTTAECTLPTCLDFRRRRQGGVARAGKSVHMVYHFPDWLTRLALYVFVSSGNLNGNPQLNIRVYNRRPAEITEPSSILHYIRHGDTEGVKRMLLEGRASVNDIFEGSGCPLWFALQYRQVAVTKLLLQAGADPYQELGRCQSSSPASIAFRISISGGHDPRVDEIAKMFPVGNYLDQANCTMLHLAVVGILHVDLAEMLRKPEYQEQINAENADELTPLHIAAAKGEAETVRVLLAAGANPNGKPSVLGPLGYACRNGNYEVAELLLQAGASTKETDAYGRGPLHYAALGTALSKEGIRLIPLLIRHGIDVNAPTVDNDTPLYYAVALGSEEAVRMLVKYGADVNFRGEDGDTVIIQAVVNGRHEVVKFFLGKGAGVTNVNDHGKDVLHYLACYGDAEMYRIFSRVKGMQDIDMSVKEADVEGKTPLQLFNERNPDPEMRKAFEALLGWVEGREGDCVKSDADAKGVLGLGLLQEPDRYDSEEEDDFYDARETWEVKS